MMTCSLNKNPPSRFTFLVRSVVSTKSVPFRKKVHLGCGLMTSGLERNMDSNVTATLNMAGDAGRKENV